jgi:uracil DNA glycosylase
MLSLPPHAVSHAVTYTYILRCHVHVRCHSHPTRSSPQSAHPSGLSASRGFFGCRHFSQTNELLTKSGLPEIDWQIN